MDKLILYNLKYKKPKDQKEYFVMMGHGVGRAYWNDIDGIFVGGVFEIVPIKSNEIYWCELNKINTED